MRWWWRSYVLAFLEESDPSLTTFSECTLLSLFSSSAVEYSINPDGVGEARYSSLQI